MNKLYLCTCMAMGRTSVVVLLIGMRVYNCYAIDDVSVGKECNRRCINNKDYR